MRAAICRRVNSSSLTYVSRNRVNRWKSLSGDVAHDRDQRARVDQFFERHVMQLNCPETETMTPLRCFPTSARYAPRRAGTQHDVELMRLAQRAS